MNTARRICLFSTIGLFALCATHLPYVHLLYAQSLGDFEVQPLPSVEPANPQIDSGAFRSPDEFGSAPSIRTMPQSPDQADPDWLETVCRQCDSYQFTALARAYFSDDQRIEWSGLEATFGVEGLLAGSVQRQSGCWDISLEGELYFNQPFDQNILVDTAERRSYLGNWDVDPLEISQLYLTARNGDWFWAMGKMTTPFGRTYFPLYSNARSDGPFIRTESILWRETGVLLQYDPGNLVFTAGLMNGGDDRDANSSKALITRIGYDGDWFAVGSSLKYNDGIGSESQKTYNEHFGIDLMFRHGCWTISAEAIYDKYGFRRPGFNANNITWRRSIYYRDQNFAPRQPITGFGYYINFGWESPQWTAMLNYGEFYPKEIGDPRHDATTRRGLVKVIYHSSRKIDYYTMVLVESDLPNAQAGRLRKGFSLLTGFQFEL